MTHCGRLSDCQLSDDCVESVSKDPPTVSGGGRSEKLEAGDSTLTCPAAGCWQRSLAQT